HSWNKSDWASCERHPAGKSLRAAGQKIGNRKAERAGEAPTGKVGGIDAPGQHVRLTLPVSLRNHVCCTGTIRRAERLNIPGSLTIDRRRRWHRNRNIIARYRFLKRLRD